MGRGGGALNFQGRSYATLHVLPEGIDVDPGYTFVYDINT